MPAVHQQLILNRYRPLENRGSGGFATVDVVFDTRLQRRVAMKRIPLTVTETDLPGINEARTAALLSDPRIVSIINFEVTGTEALIFMEYVDGPTLGTLLAESTELLSLDIIAALTISIGEALSHAHENQVLHLDIKPDNILIDHKGHVKVADFGLALLSGVAGFAEPQGGTIGYMPPEQLSAGEVDERSDLWAFAILLYQLLVGLNPFLAPSVQASYDRILHDAIVVPSAARDDIDEALDDILLQALNADKTERYSSVAAFVRELLPLLGSTSAGTKQLKARVNRREASETEGTFLSVSRSETDRNVPSVSAGGGMEPEAADSGMESQTAKDHAGANPLPLLARLPARVQSLLGRLVAALACAALAGLGASAFDLPVFTDAQFLILAGLVALVALAGFLVAQLGAALAICALSVGLLARGWYSIGIIFFVLFGAWWLLAGRLGRGDSVLVSLTALLGACWVPFATPLLIGWMLNWRRATIASLASGLLYLLLAATTTAAGSIAAVGSTVATGNTIAAGTTTVSTAALPTGLVLLPAEGLIPASLVARLAEPMTWVCLLGWVVATLALSLVAQRGSRLSGVLGAGLATILLAFAILILPLSWQTNIVMSDTITVGAVLALSFILVSVLIWLGIPSRLSDAKRNEET